MTNRILLITCASFMMGASCRKKPSETSGQENQQIEVAKPEVELRVLSVSPDEIESETSASAQVTGSGFAEGLTERLGEQAVSGIQFVDSKGFSFTIPPLKEGAYDLRVQNPDGVAHTLRSALLVTSPQPTVPSDCVEFSLYFGVDQSNVTGDVKSILVEKSHCFNGDFNYRVEGHCDERGTTEYNMALGVRRAQSIQEYIVSLGISADRIETISYGEERPEVSGSGEQAWAKNRRAVIAVFE